MDKLIREIIELHYDRCEARVVRRLRHSSSREWQDDDSAERTLWDHWKREMQVEESLFHDLIEDMVEATVRLVVDRLSRENGALMTLATDALNDLEEEPTEPIFAQDAVAAELMKRVNRRACDEPHRPEVQDRLDDQARDRFERDNEINQMPPTPSTDIEMPQQTTAWPYPNLSPRACSALGTNQALDIPLYPTDQSLSLDQYLDRLTDRVQWMLDQFSPDPVKQLRFVEQKAEGKAELPGVKPERGNLGQQIVQSWEDLLRQYAGLNQVKFPLRVHPSQQSVEAIQSLDLEGWLDCLLPPNDR